MHACVSSTAPRCVFPVTIGCRAIAPHAWNRAATSHTAAACMEVTKRHVKSAALALLVPTVQFVSSGSVAPLPSVLEYAPPENVHSIETGVALAVSAAADVWALGVTAFELLTGERAFRGSNGGPAAPAWRATQDALAGRRPLPWEPPTPDQLRKLRGLKASVLQCLVRNPDHRPTSNELVCWWNDLLDKTRAG